MQAFTADQVRLSFVGVGAMGSRLARRLLDHGYKVTVYDQNQSSVQALLKYGAKGADNYAVLAESADVILSCLTNDEAVRAVYLGRDGVLAAAKPGAVVLDMSTVSPTTSRQVNAEGAKLGIKVMDVAIPGSTPAVDKVLSRCSPAAMRTLGRRSA